MKTCSIILLSAIFVFSLSTPSDAATNNFRWNIGGGNCFVSDESYIDEIIYDDYSRILNDYSSGRVAVDCAIGEVRLTIDTLDQIYDADIWFVDDHSTDYFSCYLYSRDVDSISSNYDYFSVNYNSSSVQHEDLGTINYYGTGGVVYATCWIPRKDGAARSALYTISTEMVDN